MALPVKSAETKPILALIFLYTIGNFLLLFNRAIYWDAWVWLPLIKENNYKIIWDALYESRRFTPYYLYRISGLFNNPILFLKIMAFFSCLLAGLFLYGILRKKLSLNINRAFFISAFFILTPVFLVRIESSILQHSFNIMLFFLAAFIYFIAEKNKNKLVAAANYGLSWILFFLSFNTYSLLAFYGGFILLLLMSYFWENKDKRFLPLAALWIKNNFLFIILPIIFWSLKLSIWKDTGSAAGYDDFINFRAASPSFITLLFWETIVYGFFWQIIAPILILHRKIFFLIFLLTGFIVYLATKRIILPENKKDEDSIIKKGIDFNSKYYLIAGGILFFLGFLPYFLTEKFPHILGNPFNMRHAFLLPVGSALIILGTILSIIEKKWQPLIQKIILALFMTFTIYNYYGLDMDWYKQMAIIESLKNSSNENLKSATYLIFNDKIPGLNWLNREIHGEEYFGYLQEIYDFQKDPKFASADGEINYFNLQKDYAARPYPKDFNLFKKTVGVDITTYDGPEILTVNNWLKIKQFELFGDQKSFTDKISEIFRIKLEINP